MRFACQSCGKAYNLPEERIAEKSNVKLKCRVCGAIVEVKKHGDVVAQMLSEVDGRRGRVSEAPAPLASMSPDDPEDATAAIAITDGGLPPELGLPPLPPPPATGFALPPLPSPPLRSEPPIAPPLPPPAAMSGTPAPPPLGAEPLDMPMLNGSAMANGSSNPAGAGLGAPSANGAHAAFGHSAPLPLAGMNAEPDDDADDASNAAALANAAALSNAAAAAANLGGGAAAVTLTSVGSPDASSAQPQSDDTNKKMIAAFLTGIVVDRIVSGLFF